MGEALTKWLSVPAGKDRIALARWSRFAHNEAPSCAASNSLSNTRPPPTWTLGACSKRRPTYLSPALYTSFGPTPPGTSARTPWRSLLSAHASILRAVCSGRALKDVTLKYCLPVGEAGEK